jgi:hypothetical protein
VFDDMMDRISLDRKGLNCTGQDIPKGPDR